MSPVSGILPGVYQALVPPAATVTLRTGVPIFFGYGAAAAHSSSSLQWPVSRRWLKAAGGQSASSSSSASSSVPSWSTFSATFTFSDPAQLSATLQPYAPDPYLTTAVNGFFECGGLQCQVVLLDPGWAFPSTGAAPDSTSWTTALAAVLPDVSGVDLVCAPSLMWNPNSGGPIDSSGDSVVATVVYIQAQLLYQCNTRGDLFGVLDLPPPPLLSTQAEALAFVAETRSTAWTLALDAMPVNPARAGAVYFPWIRLARDARNYPPSGHIAGIYAYTDSASGVQKAPANEVLSGAVDAQYVLSDADQSQLDPSINCLRIFPNSGVTVWGARTLADPDRAGNWIYVSVRRLFITVGRWLVLSTQWAVFEPNDLSLWLRLNRQINTYCEQLFSNGLLKGASPADAFYIKCDAENNPVSMQNSGQLNVEVGLVPAIPGELIVVQLTQSATGAIVTTS